MPDWKILIADGLEESGLSLLRARAQVDDRSGLSPEELLRIIPAYQALIVCGMSRVTGKVFAAAENLRVVGRAGVGVDNIDLAAASARHVTVVNAPTATTVAVAEHAVALLFALARSIPRLDAEMKTGQWTKKERVGLELSGKTLGVIGVGNIGSAVAQRAAALGMQVIGCDPNLGPDAIRQRVAEPVALHDLLARADFITLHTPLMPETRGLIGGQDLARMKRGVYLVNTARGGLIDETALLGALESGQVAGAALDVFPSEPPGLTALVSHPRVIATPHIAAQTEEAQVRAARDIASEVLAALDGRPLRWKVV